MNSKSTKEEHLPEIPTARTPELNLLPLRPRQRRNPNPPCSRPSQHACASPRSRASRIDIVDQQNIAPRKLISRILNLESPNQIPPSPTRTQIELALRGLHSLQQTVPCRELPLRPQSPQPRNRFIRQQHRLIESTRPAVRRKQRYRHHSNIARPLRRPLKQHYRLSQPLAKRSSQGPYPVVLQQMQHLSELIFINAIRHGSFKRRRCHPARSTKQPLNRRSEPVALHAHSLAAAPAKRSPKRL